MLTTAYHGGACEAVWLEQIFSQLNRTRRKEFRKAIRAIAGKRRPLLPLWLRIGIQALLTIVGIVGGATFVQIRNSYPNVTPTQVDPKDALAFPFVVSNDQSLVTFYDTRPTCESYSTDLEHTSWASLWGVDVRVTLTPSVDLHPGDKAPFHFFDYSVLGLPQHLPNHMIAGISVDYEIHPLPFIRFLVWHRVKRFQFDLIKDSNGTPYWLPLYVSQ